MRATRPLSQSERDLLGARSGGYWMVVLSLSFAAGIAGALLLPLGFDGGAAVLTAFVVFMLSLNFPVAENRGSYVRDDLELDTKVVVNGRIVAKRMRGHWMRQHCVLTVADDKAEARTLEFKLPRPVFAAVQRDQPVTVWYVPASGIVMELSAGSYRYRLGDAEAGKGQSLRA